MKFRREQPNLKLIERLRAFPRGGIKPKEQGFIEVAVSIILIATLYWFITSPEEQTYWYLAFLPLVWLALRFGLSGAVVAVFGLNLLAGWIASQLDDPSQRIDLQLFLIALSLTGLFLGAIVSERVWSEARHSTAIAKLAQADRLNSLGALSAAVVHEIGQPVTTLESYAKEAARRIESGELTPSDFNRSLGHLVGETERLRQIVESVQRLGRKDRLQREAVDINEAVDNVLSMLKIEARNTGARLEVGLAPGQLTAKGDPIQLEQAILNLGRNAIQAMAGATGQEDPMLRIWTCTEGDRIGIGIQDNGPGFDAAEIDGNFEPFTSSKLDGLGLGLTISKAIVAQHDGELRVESKPSLGATFTILLPKEPNA